MVVTGGFTFISQLRPGGVAARTVAAATRRQRRRATFGSIVAKAPFVPCLLARRPEIEVSTVRVESECGRACGRDHREDYNAFTRMF